MGTWSAGGKGIRYGTLLLIFAGRLTAHDWLIVPGKRVGPVTNTSTERDLKAAFGTNVVKRALIRTDEQTAAPGLQIYADKPAESLAVVWPRKERGFRWPLLVIPCYAQTGVDCRWRTAEGVRVGMGFAELERLNEEPFLLYPDLHAKAWTNAWWTKDILAKRMGKLSERLGEDVELQFEIREEPENADWGYVASDENPLVGSKSPISRMFIHLLSEHRRVRTLDWSIGGSFWSVIRTDKTELLRESIGPDYAHRVIQQGEEGMGLYPGLYVFGGQPDRSLQSSQTGEIICGSDYENCHWHLEKPFALIMTLGHLQRLNGRPFLFNGFEWDFGGVVTSWEGGRLEKRWPGAKEHVVVCKGDYPDRLTGDGTTVRSDDPDLQKANCSVLYR
jgi:hypothetical protein